MNSNLKDEEDIMFSIYNISDWLTYVLFALFSSTYYVEFRRLDRLEMSCTAFKNILRKRSRLNGFRTIIRN